MTETSPSHTTTPGLVDENEAIWRRNYFAYGCVLLLLGISAYMMVTGLMLQGRLLGLAECSYGELNLLRQISDRLDYVFEENTSEPMTADLVARVIRENDISLNRLRLLQEEMSDHARAIRQLQSFNLPLFSGSRELLQLVADYRQHSSSFFTYLGNMKNGEVRDPGRFYDTHAHFIALKMPMLLATQNRLAEKLQVKIGERQSTLIFDFWLMSGALLFSLGAIWRVLLVPLRQQIERNCRAIRTQHDQLTYLAHWDRLTDLGNRHLFHQKMASMRNSGRLGSLALIDIDRFKSINDNFGHLYGNEALIAVGMRMKAAIGDDADLFRLGGDEFAILFDRRHDRRSVRQMLHELLEACRLPVVLREQAFNMSVSIGLASHAADMRDSEDLFAAADKTLYHAKLHGGDQMACYEDLFDRAITHYISFDTQLLEAVRLERFRAFYQPIVCLRTGRIRRLEALARLVAPDGRILTPDAWIRDAERLGLMSRVSWGILDIIKSEAPLLLEAFSDLESISFNVTSAMVADGRLERELRLSRRLNGCSWLSVELTEGCMIERGSGNIRDQLERLRKAGGLISLDDFGTGFASLAHLQHLPFDVIKIDRCFVGDIDSNNANRVILEGMIKLAQGLGKQVVCEGIENHTVLAILAEMGCEFGQGYHFSRPYPLEKFTDRRANGPGRGRVKTGDRTWQRQTG